VEVSVTDDGVGIPEDALTQIFDQLYRVDQSRNRRTGGSGLGLAIARQIIELHNGTIQAHNAPAGGAVFRFTLPV
jgi:signal transduction histidine kinase